MLSPWILVLLAPFMLTAAKIALDRIRRLPPVLYPWFEILGAIGFTSDPIKMLNTAEKQKGPVVRVNLGIMKPAVLLGAQGTKFWLKHNHEASFAFLDGIDQFLLHVFPDDFFTIEEPFSSEVQKVTHACFNRASAIDSYSAHLYAEMARSLKTWLDHKQIDIFVSGPKLVVRAEMAAFLGPEFAESHGERIAELFFQWETGAFGPLYQTLGRYRFFRQHLPWVRRVKDVSNALWSAIGEVVQKTFDANDAEQIQALYQRPDHLAVILSRMPYASVRKTTNHIAALLLAAQTNTASILGWLLTHLAFDQKFQRELQREILSIETDHPNFAQLSELPLLNYAFQETTRRYSMPVMMRCVARDIDDCMGYRLPKGTMVMISPVVHHNRSDVFDRPLEWRPMRWADEVCQISVHSNIHLIPCRSGSKSGSRNQR